METNKYTHGFKIPQDYLGNLEENLFMKLEEEKLPNTSGFNVPDSYFATLEDTVMTSVKESEKPIKVISLFNRNTIGYAAAIAACVVLIFTIFNKEESLTFNDSQFTSVYDYVEEGNLDYDDYDLYALMEEHQLTEIELTHNSFNKNTLEEYLSEDLDNTVELMYPK